jgi:hypothetical protein
MAFPIQHSRRKAFLTSHWSANGATLDTYDTSLVAVYKYNFGAGTADSKGMFTLTDNNTVGSSGFGQSGYCADFNGSDEYYSRAACTATQFGTGSFTISTWVHLDTTANYEAFLSTFGGTSPVFILRQDNTGKWSYYEDIGGDHTGGTVATGNFYHLVMTRNAASSNRADLYVNGSSVVNFTDSNNYATANAFNIGWSHDVYYMDGKQDETYIWKGAALSSSAVTALYNSGDGAFWSP